jgi:macrolide transport system ATP-binding/permease protein
MNDLKFAIRQLLKNPGFTAVAVITLALGIGANTAIFSVVDQLLVRPLPVHEPDRLILLGQSYRQEQVDYEFNYPLFRDYQRTNQVFSHLSAVAIQAVGLGTGGATERQQACLVSGNYFSMLGVDAAIGRTFAAGEGSEIDDAFVVVLSHGLWQRRFGADPQVIGNTVTVNGRTFTVIGVTPRDFAGTKRGIVPELYVPITTLGQLSADRPGGDHPLASRYFTWHNVMGRLKQGVSREQAKASIEVLARQAVMARTPNVSTNVAVLAGTQGFTNDLNDARLPLNLLLATAGLILLIACANLANLQLARAAGRSRDFAIRLALGAGRARLIRSMLTESVLLAVLGGGLGLIVAVWLVNVLAGFQPPSSQISLSSSLEPRILVFAFVIATLTGIVFGLFPALRTSRPELVPELKGGGGTTQSRVGRWNLRSGLVVVQIALSLMVLVGAGLCTRSLAKLQRLNPGFEPSRVVLASLDLGLNNYSPANAKEFYDRLLERTRTLPGVEAASLGLTTPLNGYAPATGLERVEGFEPGPNERPFGEFNIVANDYFRALGVRLLRGRDFSSADTSGGAPVVIVNQEFVQRYWPGQDAVGKRIFQHGPAGGTATEVVAVVETMPTRSLNSPATPALYFPNTQKSDLALTLAVRTGLEPSSTISQLRELVKSLDANLPMFATRTLEQQKNGSLGLQRMASTLLGGFAVLALLLASLGIYGVLSYSVSRRTREIGVRMALGAQVTDVLKLVLQQGVGMTGIGLLVGLGGAFAATRLLRGFLYEIQPFDPVTFFAVALLLALVAMVACWLPARRAARVHPMTALRNE